MRLRVPGVRLTRPMIVRRDAVAGKAGGMLRIGGVHAAPRPQ
jgi:hypothetical protein